MGAHIKDMRKRVGLSQTSLAQKIGVTKQAVSAYEAGIAKPSTATLQRLAEALSTDVGSLLTSTSTALLSSDTKDNLQNNVHALGFLADMVPVDLPFVSFRARASFIELGIGTQHPDGFETLRLYVNSEEEAARYTGALIFEVDGDSMEPLLRTGEKVIAWQVPEGKWEQIHNQVCVVSFDDTVTIKAVRENELFTKNLLTLYAQNPTAGFLPVQRQQIQSVWRVEEFFDRPKVRL